MAAKRKPDVIGPVLGSPLSRRQTLAELGFPHSTYYLWHRRLRVEREVG